MVHGAPRSGSRVRRGPPLARSFSHSPAGGKLLSSAADAPPPRPLGLLPPVAPRLPSFCRGAALRQYVPYHNAAETVSRIADARRSINATLNFVSKPALAPIASFDVDELRAKISTGKLLSPAEVEALRAARHADTSAEQRPAQPRAVPTHEAPPDTAHEAAAAGGAARTTDGPSRDDEEREALIEALRSRVSCGEVLQPAELAVLQACHLHSSLIFSPLPNTPPRQAPALCVPSLSLISAVPPRVLRAGSARARSV